MFSKDDRNFFRPFPWKSLAWIAIGLLLLLLSLESPLRAFPPNFELEIGEFRLPLGAVIVGLIHAIHWGRILLGSAFLAVGAFRLLLFLAFYTSSTTYEKNISELRQLIVGEASKSGENLLCDFHSFRPWMSSEFFVKTFKGEPKFFHPSYIVTVSATSPGADMVVVREFKLHVLQKSYELVGYRMFPKRSCITVGLTQDRVLFTTPDGDSGATVDFLEFHLVGGNVRIPIFESEILQQHGDLTNMRDELIGKVYLLSKQLAWPKV